MEAAINRLEAELAETREYLQRKAREMWERSPAGVKAKRDVDLAVAKAYASQQYLDLHFATILRGEVCFILLPSSLKP